MLIADTERPAQRPQRLWQDSTALRWGLAIGLVLGIRLVFLWWTQRTDWDGFFYLWYADGLRKGQLLAVSPLWGPYPFGYPICIAAVSLTGISSEAAARVVSILAGTLTLFPVFRMADHFGGRTAAWFSVLLVAVSPWLIWYSVSVLSESLFTLILATLFWLWTLDFEGRLPARRQPLLFVLSFAAVFTRPIALGAVAGIAVIALLLARPKALKYAGIAVAVAGLYAIYSSNVSRHLEESTRAVQRRARHVQETVGGVQPSWAIQEMSFGLGERYGARVKLPYRPGMSPVQFLRSYGVLLVRRQVDTWLQLLSDGISVPLEERPWGLIPFCLWPFGLYGAWLAARKGSGLPLLAMAPYVCSVALFRYSIRYYIPLIPVCLSFAAVGAAAALASEGMGKSRRLVLTGLLAISAAQAYQMNPHVAGISDSAREVGRWLREQHAEVVISRRPAPAYYGGARLEWLDEDLLAGVADQGGGFSLHSSGEFVVLEEQYAKKARLPENLVLRFVTTGTAPDRLYAYCLKAATL